MGEMLIFLQMRDGTQSPAVVIAALHVLCVSQSLVVLPKKHVLTWLPRMVTGKSCKFALTGGPSEFCIIRLICNGSLKFNITYFSGFI